MRTRTHSHSCPLCHALSDPQWQPHNPAADPLVPHPATVCSHPPSTQAIAGANGVTAAVPSLFLRWKLPLLVALAPAAPSRLPGPCPPRSATAWQGSGYTSSVGVRDARSSRRQENRHRPMTLHPSRRIATLPARCPTRRGPCSTWRPACSCRLVCSAAPSPHHSRPIHSDHRQQQEVIEDSQTYHSLLNKRVTRALCSPNRTENLALRRPSLTVDDGSRSGATAECRRQLNSFRRSRDGLAAGMVGG